MGDIVEFRSLKPKSRSPSREPVPVEGAQILFFLGIRYQRDDVPDVPAKAPRKRASRTVSQPKRKRSRRSA